MLKILHPTMPDLNVNPKDVDTLGDVVQLWIKKYTNQKYDETTLFIFSLPEKPEKQLYVSFLSPPPLQPQHYCHLKKCII